MGGIQKREVKRFKTSFSQNNRYEKDITNTLPPPSPLPRPDALWLLPVGAVCGDGGVWSDGLQVLRREEERVGDHVRCIGIAVPAVCEGGAGTNNVECSGRGCGNRTNRSLL